MTDAGRGSVRRAIVVMGVSGAGKTTIGRALAAKDGLAFVDGDDLHPAANVAKMQAGHPLDDEDRWPWLDRVAATLADATAYPAGVVVACSALRKVYRDRLRAGAPGIRFVLLDLTEAEALARVAHRAHHYMPASLVASQFATLERPGPDEPDVLVVDGTGAVAAIVAAIDRAV
ncbi:gluconokinase [Segnochrobactrum spirostomi]|uniref:Gluconokinase n=1 Tax=Segnochrobactrum spirostomi TaxID=2608987 RepID=A0A6A7Y5T8_9HYPH|nr:gluconokinase [Segnochrobactrum spirostomi]MQT13451.1 gluconokinase [Segnochrobactrum spirostomi]